MLPGRAKGAAPVGYGVLGELEVRDDAGTRVWLPSGHQLAVLATLLVHANRRLSTEDLIRAAWGESGVNPAQLHKAVAALRDLLEPVGRRPDIRTHARFGYELHVAEDDVDMLRFRRHVQLAEDAKAQQRVDDEISALRAALQEWRGQHALSNVVGDVFRREAFDLGQRRKRVAVRLFHLESGRRRYESILEDLTTMADYFPTDCPAAPPADDRALPLRAHGRGPGCVRAAQGRAEGGDRRRSGHNAAGPEVRHRQGGRGAIAAMEVPAERPPIAPAPAVVAVPQQLPPDPADFVGREELVEETTWLLSGGLPGRVPVLVISGAGGIGKTAVAVRVAHLVRDRYPDGQLFAELRSAAGQPADPAEILAQFLRAFGAPTVPETRAERTALYPVVDCTTPGARGPRRRRRRGTDPRSRAG